jgi:hypothetical protein
VYPSDAVYHEHDKAVTTPSDLAARIRREEETPNEMHRATRTTKHVTMAPHDTGTEEEGGYERVAARTERSDRDTHASGVYCDDDEEDDDDGEDEVEGEEDECHDEVAENDDDYEEREDPTFAGDDEDTDTRTADDKLPDDSFKHGCTPRYGVDGEGTLPLTKASRTKRVPR